MNHICIISSNINRFIRYSYIIIKRMRTGRFIIINILFKYIIHLIILVKYQLYKSKCDFYIRPNVVVVADSNENVVYRISLNDYAVNSVKNNY